jgi:hypothetical protein
MKLIKGMWLKRVSQLPPFKAVRLSPQDIPDTHLHLITITDY